MFSVTTVLPHNLLQTNPFVHHNFSTQVFRKRAAQLHYVDPELRYIFWPPLETRKCSVLVLSSLAITLCITRFSIQKFYILPTHYTRVGTLIVATIYLQLIQNRYMFRSFTDLHCSHQHCVQPVASDVEVVGYL